MAFVILFLGSFVIIDRLLRHAESESIESRIKEAYERGHAEGYNEGQRDF